MRKLFLFIAFILAALSHGVNAQVTIGSGIAPERGALLDLKNERSASALARDFPSLKNSEKGLLIPRVMLVANDNLSPLYADPDATDDEILLATGMIVYNVNPNADGLEVGLYIWDGEKWLALIPQSERDKAVIDPMDCDVFSQIGFGGEYTVGEALDADLNTLSLPVSVSARGSFTFTAFPQNSNGYYFKLQDEFLTEGDFVVKLKGVGIPQTARTDLIELYIDGEKVSYAGCTDLPEIIVSTNQPNYTIDCSSISVPTTLSAGQALTSSDVITLKISSDASDAGKTFQIQTNLLNGVKFATTATLTGTVEQEIQLVGEGTPQNGGNFTYTITSNSRNAANICSDVVINYAAVVERTINVAIFSITGDARDLLDPLAENKSVRRLLENTANFGPDITSTVRVAGINFSNKGSIGGATNFQSAINEGADIILISYNCIPTEDAINNQLIPFVEGGGVVIYCTDGDATRNARATTMINGVCGDGTSVSITSAYTGSTAMDFVGQSSVITGPFLNLTGHKFGRDSGSNVDVTVASLPPVAEALVYGDNGVRAMMHKTKGFIFIGDGAPFSGNNASLSATDFPARHSNGFPVPHPNYSPNVYNSYFFCNIMAWAISHVVSQ